MSQKATKLPVGSSSGMAFQSLGYNSAKGNSNYKVGDNIGKWNIKTWITGQGKAVLLKYVEDDLIDELITASDQF